MAANLLGGIIFGSIGFAAFVYGKKNARYKAMTIGLLLMGYTWVVSSNAMVYGVGIALTAALFLFKD